MNVALSCKKAPFNWTVCSVCRGSPELLYEGDISVPPELEYGDLQYCGDAAQGFWLDFLALHLNRFATEFFCKFGQFSAGLVEPAIAVTADPLCGVGSGVRVGRVRRGVQQLADAASDQLLLLAVFPCHVLDLGACVVQCLWLFG